MITQDSPNVIFDFKKAKILNDWYIINDGVMGGLSKGTFRLNEESYGVFEGTVTTENNGGFTSVRYSFDTKDVSDYSVVKIRLKGDGKRYEFRIKKNVDQQFSYIHYFETSGEWETITLPLKSFYPSFRGQKLNKDNYDGMQMEEVTFLIGNGKKESFALQIKFIKLE